MTTMGAPESVEANSRHEISSSPRTSSASASASPMPRPPVAAGWVPLCAVVRDTVAVFLLLSFQLRIRRRRSSFDSLANTFTFSLDPPPSSPPLPPNSASPRSGRKSIEPRVVNVTVETISTLHNGYTKAMRFPRRSNTSDLIVPPPLRPPTSEKGEPAKIISGLWARAMRCSSFSASCSSSWRWCCSWVRNKSPRIVEMPKD